ncbi:hypothetical protein TNCV_2077341 [Trichonephila clavipes]|nr:hypothetical protein TNCV_2077341 [Trichonephila clavipes]
MNEESATIALRKYRVQKNVMSGKAHHLPRERLGEDLVKWLEETESWRIEHESRRPCLKRSTCTLHCCRNGSDCVRSSSGTSNEDARRLSLPMDHLSAIFFVESSAVPIKIAIEPRTFASRYRLHTKDPSSLKNAVPSKWMDSETVNARRYLTLLRETVVLCLIQRGQISNATFMQDGATSHTANPVKAFLIQRRSGKTESFSRRFTQYPWPPPVSDLTPSDFFSGDI